MSIISVDEWIHEKITKKGYVNFLEDSKDFFEQTGEGLSGFDKLMLENGLKWERKSSHWTVINELAGEEDKYSPPDNPTNHVELMDYRRIWKQIQNSPSIAEVARLTDIPYRKLLDINSMLEHFWVEGVLKNWLDVTEKLLEVQNRRGHDHKSDRLMLELRQVFVEYVRHPDKFEPPTNEDIEWVYQELVSEFSISENVDQVNEILDRPLTAIEKIIDESGQHNFPKNQGAWGRFEIACKEITNCGWKMGMCKSDSGKDNAINRLYTTGVIRSYPEVLIQCLFIDAFLDEISEVYQKEFGEKMRCSPILILVSEDKNNIWRPVRILVQHRHPLLPMDKDEIEKMFPLAEIIPTKTMPLQITDGWESGEQGPEKDTHQQLLFSIAMRSGIIAEAYVNDGEKNDEMVVLKGSTAKGGYRTPLPIKLVRDALVAQGSLVEQKDGTYLFTRDVPFSSPSAAASLICGATKNGRVTWREKKTRRKYVEIFGRVNPVIRNTVQSKDIDDTSKLHDTINEVLKLQKFYNSTKTPEMESRGFLVRKKAPSIIRSWISNYPNLHCKGSDGVGRKTRIPWFRIFDPLHSPSATSGWYLVYLFSFDGSCVYLSLNQGTTRMEDGNLIPRSPWELKEKVGWARDVLPAPSTISRELNYGTINLADKKQLGRGYERGDVMNFSYSNGNIPKDDELNQHLNLMIDLLLRLYQSDLKL